MNAYWVVSAIPRQWSIQQMWCPPLTTAMVAIAAATAAAEAANTGRIS